MKKGLRTFQYLTLILFSFLFSSLGFSFCIENLDQIPLNTKKEVNIGLFIGTFAPFHARHLEIASSVLQNNLDYLLIVPNDLTLHKPDAISAYLRLEMLKVQFETHEKIGVFCQSQSAPYFLEKEARKKINSLIHVKPKLFGIIGLDSYISYKTQIAIYIVQAIDAITPFSTPPKRYDHYYVTYTRDDLNSDFFRQNQQSGSLPKTYCAVPLDFILSQTDRDIHSTELRRFFSNPENEKRSDYHDIVNPAVIDYIWKHQVRPDPLILETFTS